MRGWVVLATRETGGRNAWESVLPSELFLSIVTPKHSISGIVVTLHFIAICDQTK